MRVRTHLLSMILQLCVLFVVGVVKVHSAETQKLPETFQLCKNDGNIGKCLTTAITSSLKELKGNGVPGIGVPSLDPLKVAAVEIGQGQGPISINMKFTDIIVTGLSDSIVDNADDVDLKATKLIFTGAAEDVNFDADYVLSGRILLLPVTGKGRCKLTFKNLGAKSGPSGKLIQKKGKDYFNVTDYKLDITRLDKLTVNFENLFNGDKNLGQSMNALLNENWKDLWNELEPAFEETFGAVFFQYSKRIFDKVAFKDIFLDP